MDNISITVNGSKGSGKTTITALIVNCLKNANFKNVQVKAKNSDVNYLRRAPLLQKEFIHFFNEEDSKVIIREYHSTIQLENYKTQYPNWFNPLNIHYLLGYYDAEKQCVISNHEMLNDLSWGKLQHIGFDQGCFFIVINDGKFCYYGNSVDVKRGDFIATNGNKWKHLPQLKTQILKYDVYRRLKGDG